jgi:hypothetical protein
MDQARFTLTFGGFSHDEAFALLERLEAELRIDAMAITINETD